jgi:hypothetical protein
MKELFDLNYPPKSGILHNDIDRVHRAHIEDKLASWLRTYVEKVINAKFKVSTAYIRGKR